MSHKVTCHECKKEVSNATGRTVGAEKVWVCGVCDGQHDPCRQCGSHDVVYDDHGVTLCGLCKKNATTDQKVELYEHEYADALDSGNPVADHMPLPRSWQNG